MANSATINQVQQTESSSDSVLTTPPRTAIAGVSGYAGGELARLLLRHPRFKGITPTLLGRAGEVEVGPSTFLEDLHPQLATPGNHEANEVFPFSWKRIVDSGIEILFLATPHEQSREWVPEAIEKGIKVIDLSGAWRLKNDANRAVYRLKDANPQHAGKLQADAVYGCPELHRNEIKQAHLVANPGCYATSIILALAPLIQADIVDGHRVAVKLTARVQVGSTTAARVVMSDCFCDELR